MIQVTGPAVAAIVTHARTTNPAECCGVLLGRGNRIDEAWPAHNLSERPMVRFILDPRDHFEAVRDGRRRGLDVVGFYHSHPRSPAEPSDTDRAEAGYPDALHLIVSLVREPPDIGLFRFVDGNFLAVPLVTVG